MILQYTLAIGSVILEMEIQGKTEGVPKQQSLKRVFFSEWVQMERKGQITYFATKVKMQGSYWRKRAHWLFLFKQRQYETVILSLTNEQQSLSEALERLKDAQIKISWNEISEVQINREHLKIIPQSGRDYYMSLGHSHRAMVWKFILQKVLNSVQYETITHDEMHRGLVLFPSCLEDIFDHLEVDQFLNLPDTSFQYSEKVEILSRLKQFKNSLVNLTKYILGKIQAASCKGVPKNSSHQQNQLIRKQKQALARVDSLCKQNDTLNQRVKELNEQVNGLMEQIDRLKKQVTWISDPASPNKSYFEQQMKDLQMKNDRLELVCSDLKGKEAQFHSKQQSLENRISQLQSEKNSQEEEYKLKLHTLQEQIERLTQDKSNLSLKYQDLSKTSDKDKLFQAKYKECEVLSQQNRELQEQLLRLQRSPQNKQLELKHRQEIQMIMKETRDLEYQLKAQRKQTELLKQQNYLHLFEGGILRSYCFEKEYLKDQIEVYTNKEVMMTSLIYRFDPLNTTNFHKYIDNHRNLCLLVRLKNYRVVAGFSVGAIIEGTASTEGGLILSLTERRAFKLMQGRRSVTFDSYFLIFGNSELRMRQGEQKLFSNFGINNSYYNSEGQNYTVLMGQDSNREEEVDNYQIFEVIFK